MISLITILLLISTNLVFADVIMKDADTATITTSQDFTVKDLQSKITTYQDEKRKCNAQWDGFIAPVQAQIDQAAQAGVVNAIPLASPDVQQKIAASVKQSVPMQPVQNVNWPDVSQ